MLSYLVDRKKRQYFNDLRDIQHNDWSKYRKMKKIVLHMCSTKLHSIFEHWKCLTKQQDVLDENEFGEGPVSLQVWGLRMKLRHLKKMLREDGQPNAKIEQIIE